MYRQYLDSEITFDELMDQVAALVAVVCSPGEPARDLRRGRPGIAGASDTVTRDHQIEGLNDSDIGGYTDLEWYFTRDSNERTCEDAPRVG